MDIANVRDHSGLARAGGPGRLGIGQPGTLGHHQHLGRTVEGKLRGEERPAGRGLDEAHALGVEQAGQGRIHHAASPRAPVDGDHAAPGMPVRQRPANAGNGGVRHGVVELAGAAKPPRDRAEQRDG